MYCKLLHIKVILKIKKCIK